MAVTVETKNKMLEIYKKKLTRVSALTEDDVETTAVVVPWSDDAITEAKLTTDEQMLLEITTPRTITKAKLAQNMPQQYILGASQVETVTSGRYYNTMEDLFSATASSGNIATLGKQDITPASHAGSSTVALEAGIALAEITEEQYDELAVWKRPVYITLTGGFNYSEAYDAIAGTVDTGPFGSGWSDIVNNVYGWTDGAGVYFISCPAPAMRAVSVTSETNRISVVYGVHDGEHGNPSTELTYTIPGRLFINSIEVTIVDV